MLAHAQIGVEEYLALAFPDRPEPDYVHGEVVERASPRPIHARIQVLLGRLFGTSPAFIAIEIVSPDANYSNLTRRLDDYRRWGVPHVWLVDPWLERLSECTEAGLLQRASLALPDLDFAITAEEIFKDL
jgi:Uma2 family endonuclease